jgi:hypothetical protein
MLSAGSFSRWHVEDQHAAHGADLQEVFALGAEQYCQQLLVRCQQPQQAFARARALVWLALHPGHISGGKGGYSAHPLVKALARAGLLM